MRIATWNVNSLNARMERVEQWIAAAQPDVLALQETKMSDEQFPVEQFDALGYESVHHGEGRWNGVALLSRVGLSEPVAGFAPGIEPDPDARLVTAVCEGIRISSAYVPNGRDPAHDHYRYKLDWLTRLRDHLDATTSPEAPALVVGDFNICPDDRDLWNPENPEPRTHVTPAERAALAALTDWGLIDVFRERYDAAGLYSWWDYRGGSFYKRMGMRIDLLLGTRPVADAVTFCLIDRNARKGDKPSDHTPVFADLDTAALGLAGVRQDAAYR